MCKIFKIQKNLKNRQILKICYLASTEGSFLYSRVLFLVFNKKQLLFLQKLMLVRVIKMFFLEHPNPQVVVFKLLCVLKKNNKKNLL